jgi:hypothetical protein
LTEPAQGQIDLPESRTGDTIDDRKLAVSVGTNIGDAAAVGTEPESTVQIGSRSGSRSDLTKGRPFLAVDHRDCRAVANADIPDVLSLRTELGGEPCHSRPWNSWTADDTVEGLPFLTVDDHRDTAAACHQGIEDAASIE